MTETDLQARQLFAHNLKRLREEAELSLRALSELTGMSHGRLSELEAGSRSCNLETLDRVAAAFDVPVAALFDETGFEKPKRTKR